MADTPILNYKGKYDGPEIDKAVELALGLENPESCPYYVHVSLSQPDYVLTIGLGDAEGNLFNHTEIDLPLESMVVNATYENGNIILHLQDGTSTEPIPISALIAGLVSETRTIAGIDLKDDITPKELRDALDVYTKDSVDQLVSDLEDRIDETLNEMKQSLDDLSERTSEHDTQIKKNTSDIAVNRATLGTQRKNLLSVNDGTATRFIDKIINQIEPGKYILSIGKLTSTDANSSICLCLFTDSYNTPLSNNVHLKRGTDISATVTINEPATKIRIYASNDWNNSDGDTVTASNIMLRPADVTDPTYEPYKPSVNERLVEVENNKLNFAYFVARNTTNTAGWFEVAKCDFVPSGSGNVRDITLCIQLTNANNTVGAKWAILNVATVIGGTSASWTIDTMVVSFIVNKGFDTSDDNPDIIIVGTTDGTTVNLAIWCKLKVQHAYCRGIPLIDAARVSLNQFNTPNYWQLLNTTTKYDSYPTDWQRKIIPTDYYGEQLPKTVTLNNSKANPIGFNTEITLNKPYTNFNVLTITLNTTTTDDTATRHIIDVPVQGITYASRYMIVCGGETGTVRFDKSGTGNIKMISSTFKELYVISVDGRK